MVKESGVLRVAERDLAVVGALDRGDPGRDRHRVVVGTELGEALAAGEAPREHGRVVEGVPHLLRVGRESGGSGDLHAVGSFDDVRDVRDVRCRDGISPSAWRRRSSQSSLGEIGIRVIGKPSASSMADGDDGRRPGCSPPRRRP